MTPVSSVRLAPDTVIDACDLLQADRFELVDDTVTFVATAAAAGRRWTGRLGDDLVHDGNGFWRIVSAEPWNPLTVWADPVPAPKPIG